MSASPPLYDPAEIYAESFRIVREHTAGLDIPPRLRSIAERMVHASGRPELWQSILWSSDLLVVRARRALRTGAVVFCDCEMVRQGIRSLWPEAQCYIGDARVHARAQALGETRAAAAVDFWQAQISNAIILVGNAPTCLFRLLERIDAWGEKPALVIGLPIGFVGAAESRRRLAERTDNGFDWLTSTGNEGGSALAAAAFNALAAGLNSETPDSAEPGGSARQAEF